jgi:hypothetical protein
MTDVESILQYIRNGEREAGFFEAKIALADNPDRILEILNKAASQEELPNLRDLQNLVNKQLEDYWPELQSKVRKIGIYRGNHNTGFAIASAIHSRLLDKKLKKPKGPRLRLDKQAKRLAIDGVSYPVSDPECNAFAILIPANGAPEQGKIIGANFHTVWKRMKKPLHDLIESSRQGYRIKEEFCPRKSASVR